MAWFPTLQKITSTGKLLPLNLTMVGMTNQKIIQVRYRNPRHMLEIFWAEEVFECDASFQFTGCRVMRICTAKGTGLFKKYHKKLKTITIPNTLEPVYIKAEMPEWWTRGRLEAETELTATVTEMENSSQNTDTLIALSGEPVMEDCHRRTVMEDRSGY
jgi:hypothetical protein